MPCYVTGSEAGDARLAQSETYEKLIGVTRLLCVTCESLPRTAIDKLPKSVQIWWAEHERIDMERRVEDHKRLKRKKIKEDTLKKLSQEERQILGL